MPPIPQQQSPRIRKADPKDILANSQRPVPKEKFWTRLGNKIRDTFNIYRQINLDTKYRKEYRRRIRELAQDPTSDFVKFRLRISDNQETISCLIRLPNEFIAADDYMIYERLNNDTFFITSYLRDNVGFDLYVSLPEFFHLEEPGRPDAIMLSYIAFWNFQPMIDAKRKKKYLSWLYGVSSFLVCGITALVLCLTL